MINGHEDSQRGWKAEKQAVRACKFVNFLAGSPVGWYHLGNIFSNTINKSETKKVQDKFLHFWLFSPRNFQSVNGVALEISMDLLSQEQEQEQEPNQNEFILW